MSELEKTLDELYNYAVCDRISAAARGFYERTGRPATHVLVDPHMLECVATLIRSRAMVDLCASGVRQYVTLDGARLVPAFVEPGTVALPLAYEILQ